MIVAFGTDLEVAFNDLAVDDFIAGVAFDPKLVRELQPLSPLLHGPFSLIPSPELIAPLDLPSFEVIKLTK
jgi:hypothetical protein